MPPLGHAVGLVDDEQRDPAARKRVAEGGRAKALRRREDELRLARLDVAQRLLVVAVLHPRRQHARAHARPVEPRALI